MAQHYIWYCVKCNHNKTLRKNYTHIKNPQIEPFNTIRICTKYITVNKA